MTKRLESCVQQHNKELKELMSYERAIRTLISKKKVMPVVQGKSATASLDKLKKLFPNHKTFAFAIDEKQLITFFLKSAQTQMLFGMELGMELNKCGNDEEALNKIADQYGKVFDEMGIIADLAIELRINYFSNGLY